MPDLAICHVESHEDAMGPHLELVHVPLGDISSLRRVSLTTQLGAVCRLAKDTLDPTVNVTDEEIEDWSQYRPLRDTTHH